MPQKHHLLWAFGRELEKPDPNPERLALYIAGIGHPDLDVQSSLHLLDDIAARVGEKLFSFSPGRPRAEHFLSVLNSDLHFDGNHNDYYQASNSFLNEVLERRLGLPITLSLVCMAVGRRLGLKVDGVGLPGHFMARYEDEAGTWFLDPFNGKVMARADIPEHLSRIFRQPIPMPAEAFNTVSADLLAFRILNNLRHIYLEDQNFTEAVDVLDYMLVLAPNEENLWQERGQLNFYLGNMEEGARDLRRYFFLRGLLLLSPALSTRMATRNPSTRHPQASSSMRRFWTKTCRQSHLLTNFLPLAMAMRTKPTNPCIT